MHIIKRKNGYYYARYFDSGREVRVSLKTKSKTIARVRLLDVKKIGKTVSFPELKSNYLNYISAVASRCYYNSVAWTFSKVPETTPDELRSKLLETYINSKSVAMLHFRNLRAFFGYLIRTKTIRENPLSGFKFPKMAQKENLTINEMDFTRLLSNEKDGRLKAVYSVLYYTGLRISELLNLKKNDIKDGLIYIRNSEKFTTKSKKNRIVPLSQSAAEALEKLSDEYLSSLTRDRVTKRFKIAARTTLGNDTKLHLHNLRGSFASNLISAGVNIVIVKELLGHSSVTVTEKNYLKVNLKDMIKAVEGC